MGRSAAKPSFTGEVGSGDTRRGLEALRDHLAAAVEVAEPHNVASLSRQLHDVLKSLAALPVEKKGSLADELAGRRTRRAGAVNVDGAPTTPGRREGGR